MTSIDWTHAVRRAVLPNGLTVLIEPNRSAPVVASVAHVRAGYFDEPDEWVGIAHVLEHMFFKGTRRRSPGAMARETQLLGGYLNAGTIYDKTVYYTVLPAGPDAVRRVVDLQSDGLMHATIDADELERELEVIVQEAKRKLDSPAAVTIETLFAQLFARHRIRRWRIGTEAGLRGLTAQDVRAYYESRYAPERTVVALVGDLDPDEALDAVERHYGAWHSVRAQIPAGPAETKPPPPALRLVTGDILRPQVSLGWRTVGPLHPDAVPLDVAAGVLGTGRGAWLARAVRTPGMASSARAHHYTPTEVGVFDVSLEGPAAEMGRALATTLGLVQRLADRGPDAADLDRVRSLMRVGWSRRLEGMDTRASLFCQFEALGGLPLLNRMYEDTLAVERADVQRVAEQYLDVGRVSGAGYAADPADVGIAADDWPPVAATPALDRRPNVGLPRSPHSTLRTGRARGEVVHVESERTDLLVRSKRGSGLAHLAVFAPRTREFERAETAGISALAIRAALRGTTVLDAEQLADGAERLGGTLIPSMLAGAVGWTVTVRADAAAEAANLLFHLATDAVLDDEAVETERALQLSDARRAEDDMFNYPIRRVLGLAHPDSPHGLPLLGEPRTLASINGNAVREWMDRIRGRRIVAVAVGDLGADQLVESLAPFSRWPGDGPVDRRAGGIWAPRRESIDRDKAQTALAMAFPAQAHGRDREELLVLGSLLSGLAGRLFEELRERRSLAYTVSATAWQRHDAGAVLTYIATAPARAEEARDAMLDELDRVAVDRIAPDELDRATRSVAGSMQLRLQSSESLAAEMFEAWNRGELDGLATSAERIRAVTEDRIRDLAARVFDRDQRAEFVLRGRETEESA